LCSTTRSATASSPARSSAGINYRDFFDRQLLHADYCLACFKLEQQEQDRLPGLLRSVLRLPDYRTKARRMGKIISWTETGVTHLTI